jgi:hypothetical protein
VTAQTTNALWSIGIIFGIALATILGLLWSVYYGSVRIGLASIIRKIGGPVLRWLDPEGGPLDQGASDGH